MTKAISNNREAGKGGRVRYRAKAMRRPIRFWWQAFVLLTMIVLMWAQLPLGAVLYEPRVFTPLPEPHVAYVHLSPAEAADAMAALRASWMPGDAGGYALADMDPGLFDLREEPGLPSLFVQGERSPETWHPAAIVPLAAPLPELKITARHAATEDNRALQPAQGIKVVLDSQLTAAAFEFEPRPEILPERAGEARFQVETDECGKIVHLLLLSKPGASTNPLERMLLMGQARCAVRGQLDIIWRLPEKTARPQDPASN